MVVFLSLIKNTPVFFCAINFNRNSIRSGPTEDRKNFNTEYVLWHSTGNMTYKTQCAICHKRYSVLGDTCFEIRTILWMPRHPYQIHNHGFHRNSSFFLLNMNICWYKNTMYHALQKGSARSLSVYVGRSYVYGINVMCT